MIAGKLRHRIALQSQSLTQDSYGQAVVSWGTYATVWASVQPLTGREYFSADSLQSEVKTVIKIRYQDGIDTSMRVLWGTRVYNIVSLADVFERNREIHLYCTEGSNNGD